MNLNIFIIHPDVGCIIYFSGKNYLYDKYVTPSLFFPSCKYYCGTIHLKCLLFTVNMMTVVIYSPNGKICLIMKKDANNCTKR